MKHDDKINDFEAIRLLNFLDGGWLPGEVNGTKVPEKNPFNVEVLNLKALSLLRLGRKDETCRVLALAESYYLKGINDEIVNSCP